MKTVALTHADKIMFPESGITKGELAQYYERVFRPMLPHLKDRPLTLHRFPDGLSGEGFFQKNAPAYFPDWVRTAKIRKKDGWVHHVICDSADTLKYLVNHGTIAFHTALSRTDKLHYPDKLIFDLDPPGDDFKTVVEGAKILRDFLENELRLSSFVMTTGSKGLHIAVPLKRTEHFDEVHAFTKNIAEYLSSKYPEKYTVAMRKDQRRGRLFIDYVRNSYGQTGVCPFSVRAIEGAPVATPLTWEELHDKSLNARTYTVKNIFDRLMKKGDAWGHFKKEAKSIQQAKNNLRSITGETRQEKFK